MNIMALLDYLQTELESAGKVPFSNNYFINKDKCLDLLQDIRNTLPVEIMEAEQIKSEKNRIMYEAEKEADAIYADAQMRVKQMVDETEIVQMAYSRAEQVIENADKGAREIHRSANEYVEDILSDLESYIQRNLDIVRQNRDQMRGR